MRRDVTLRLDAVEAAVVVAALRYLRDTWLSGNEEGEDLADAQALVNGAAFVASRAEAALNRAGYRMQVDG